MTREKIIKAANELMSLFREGERTDKDNDFLAKIKEAVTYEVYVNEEMVIDLGFANLVVEKKDDFHEFSIYLTNKETGAIQDIALVHQARDEYGNTISDAVQCVVWAESDNEEHTDKFLISKCI